MIVIWCLLGRPFSRNKPLMFPTLDTYDNIYATCRLVSWIDNELIVCKFLQFMASDCITWVDRNLINLTFHSLIFGDKTYIGQNSLSTVQITLETTWLSVTLNRSTANGAYLRHRSASNRSRSGLAKYRQRYVLGSNSAEASAFECARDFRYEFDPRSGLASRFDHRGHVGSFFGLFIGANSSNPVLRGPVSVLTWYVWFQQL